MGGRGASSAGSRGAPGTLPNGLDRELVRRANEASLSFPMGDMTSDRLDRNISEINGMDLTTEQRRSAIERQRELATEALESRAGNPSQFVAGPARFDVRRAREGADRTAQADHAMDAHMESLRRQSTRQREESARQRRGQAFQDAIASGQLTVTVDGVTYARKSKRSTTFRVVS